MKPPDITAAEWTVMEVLWKESPQTASAVFKTLRGSTGWALNTVRTMLTRLVEKGAVRAERLETAPAQFHAAVPREECVRAESESFLQRVFQGAASSLVLHFAGDDRLTPAQVRELQQLLEKNAKQRKR